MPFNLFRFIQGQTRADGEATSRRLQAQSSVLFAPGRQRLDGPRVSSHRRLVFFNLPAPHGPSSFCKDGTSPLKAALKAAKPSQMKDVCNVPAADGILTLPDPACRRLKQLPTSQEVLTGSQFTRRPQLPRMPLGENAQLCYQLSARSPFVVVNVPSMLHPVQCHLGVLKIACCRQCRR